MKRIAIMSQNHPRWGEFVQRLEGPKGCNFREVKGEIRWNCEGDHKLSTAILEDIGNIDVTKSLSYFKDSGGYCDCEVIFNVAGDVE